MALDDLTLVDRVKTGDQRAFKQLVERYQRRVYALAYGLVRDKEEARDISQDAFVRVYKYIAAFKGQSSFYTWLYRITVNLCTDLNRRRAAAGPPAAEFDETLINETEDPHAGLVGGRLGTNPQKSALNRELAQKLEEALAEIPEKHRAILLLRELDGMSYEDLAHTLKVPKGTVMSRLFHARAKVQRKLNEYIGLDESETRAKDIPEDAESGENTEGT